MKFFALASRYLLTTAIILAAASCAKTNTEAQPASSKEQPTMGAAMTYVDFKTNLGDFTAKLYTDKAPLTTANFIGLAEGTRSFIDANTGQELKRPFYNGLIFHRVIPNFMIQGGDPLGTGTGSPGYRFKDEFDPSLSFDKPGLLAMANSGPNTNGSQFFITVAPTTWLTGKHTIFGEIVKGMDVVYAIAKVPRDPGDRPLTPVVMKEVKVYQVDASGNPLPAGK